MSLGTIDKTPADVEIDDYKFGMVTTSALDKRKIPSEGAEVIYDFYVEASNLVKRKGKTKANASDLGAIPHSLAYFRQEI
jgi:hypothetical protein